MDEIIITLPAKPEYISVARLTVSGIANRMGFSIDEIEDMKVAVSEAGIFLMKQGCKIDTLSIVFTLEDNCGVTTKVQGINITPVEEIQPSEQNELSLFIIESLMDKVEVDIKAGIVNGITLFKSCGGRA